MMSVRVGAAFLYCALGLTACGGDSSTQAPEKAASATADPADFAAAVNHALGAGGSGSLTFDGEDIAATSVTCKLESDAFDVGTVSAEGFRILVNKRDHPDSSVNVQILDSQFVQWFPKDFAGDEALRDGTKITSRADQFTNSKDHRVVEVSFQIQCP